MKHPGPWKMLGGTGYIIAANGEIVCHVSDSDGPETRAVLLHAGEMFAAMVDLWARRPHIAAAVFACDELMAKINAEIAGKQP